MTTHKALLPDISNIAITGRIGTGASTLAKNLAEKLGWDLLDGGKLFRELSSAIGISINKSNSRPDHFDLAYEEKVKTMFKKESGHIIQSHLAGFDAQGVDGVFKILVICEDKDGNDKKDIRIDRLVNRDGIPIEKAKYEIGEREKEHLTKFRRLYANNDSEWVYWDKKYFDLVINTYTHNKDESVAIALDAIGYSR